jgi:hypothetical protein
MSKQRPTAAFDVKWGNFVVPDYFTRLVYEGV